MLNAGQQKAADEFFRFLFSDAKEFDIRGPGGVGKTWLMGHFIDTVLPQYEEQCALMGVSPTITDVEMTATTNKAAEVLSLVTKQHVPTIHSFLSLKVANDFKTGETKLTRRNEWKVKENTLVFIDEASMIDSKLYFEIHAALGHQSKIVYIGDRCQLPPVMERVSPVYRNSMSHVELTENVRAANQPALLDLCQQFRETTLNGQFLPIQAVPGVIDHVNEIGLQQEIDRMFSSQNLRDRILCYTNDRVRMYNEYIREIRGLPEQIVAGERLVNNSTYISKDFVLGTDVEVEVVRTGDSSFLDLPLDLEPLEFRVIHVARDNWGRTRPLNVPTNPDYYHEVMKFVASKKAWDVHYRLKEEFADLRPRDTGTVYKAQGSTYETVIIDLDDIGSSNNPQHVAHMLYVAVSRPKSRIILFGELPDKYGGPVQ